LIDSTAELIGEQAPVIITDTRNALTFAEDGAIAIDQVLRTLAVFGPITGVTYSPERSLNEGLSEVAESLGPLPAALREVGDELGQAASSLETIGSSLDEVGEELGSFAEDISGKSAILANLAGDLDTLSRDTNAARGKIGPVVLVLSTVLELLLIGQALGQSAIFHVGRSMSLR
jgi:ABC-type transporter Mla subunit MlaD